MIEVLFVQATALVVVLFLYCILTITLAYKDLKREQKYDNGMREWRRWCRECGERVAKGLRPRPYWNISADVRKERYGD